MVLFQFPFQIPPIPSVWSSLLYDGRIGANFNFIHQFVFVFMVYALQINLKGIVHRNEAWKSYSCTLFCFIQFVNLLRSIEQTLFVERIKAEISVSV